jgi:hypothetical protein
MDLFVNRTALDASLISLARRVYKKCLFAFGGTAGGARAAHSAEAPFDAVN